MAKILNTTDDARAWRREQASSLRGRAAELQRRAQLAAKTGRRHAADRMTTQAMRLRREAAALAA